MMASWSRADWVDCFADLSVAFARAAALGGSPARALLYGAPPDDPIPSIEGFARMSVAWGAWLGQPANPTVVGAGLDRIDLLELHVRGLLDATDPDGPFSWGGIGDRDQRIVEAAELATGLWLGRSRLVPALGPDGLRQVLDWLSRVDGKDVYEDNWVLFPALVAAVRRSFGVSLADEAIDTGIDWMLARYRGDGWYADGGGHAFDQYTGWAVHWHLLLWSRIEPERRARTRALIERRFRTYLASIAPMFAADGTRPLFGRSLGYRFAAAAPFALAAVFGLDALPDDVARRIAGGTIRRHLADGALDPSTGWFRRGVADERADVLERYVSAGASAWAMHAFVALGLDADAPFWRASEGRLPVEQRDGVRPMRGPGLLIGWRKRTGETWLVNARADHPDDIPGHDYTPYYGKSTFRSRFPLTVRTSDGHPGPDGALLFIGPRSVDHRRLTLAGDVGPTWAWSRYHLALDDATHDATTVTLLWRDVEVRLTAVRPGGPIRLMEAPAALGASNGDEIRRSGSTEAGWQAASSRDASVATKILAGFDVALASGPFGDGPDRNLVAPHAEQPALAESTASDRPRVVGSVSWAGADPSPPLVDLAAVRSRLVAPWVVDVSFGDEARAMVDLRPRGGRSLQLDGVRAEGPSVRLLRVTVSGDSIAGESIRSIDGIVHLDAPGPIALRRTGAGVEAWAECGLGIDPDWAGRPLLAARVRGLDDAWSEAVPLASPGVVASDQIRRWQRRVGRRLLELRLEP